MMFVSACRRFCTSNNVYRSYRLAPSKLMFTIVLPHKIIILAMVWIYYRCWITIWYYYNDDLMVITIIIASWEYTYLYLQYDITLYFLHHIIVISIVYEYVHNYAHYGGMKLEVCQNMFMFFITRTRNAQTVAWWCSLWVQMP